MSNAAVERRTGPSTRAAIQEVALELFTRKGYEATSMREIAEALGIRKASIYYHFAAKEEILRALFAARGDEAEALLAWVAARPQDPALVEAAVLRWVSSSTRDKLRGIRFLAANPLLARTVAGPEGDRIGSSLGALVDALVPLLPHQGPGDELQLRMALLSVNGAVGAAAGADFTDDDIVDAARRHAAAVIASLVR